MLVIFAAPFTRCAVGVALTRATMPPYAADGVMSRRDERRLRRVAALDYAAYARRRAPNI